MKRILSIILIIVIVVPVCLLLLNAMDKDESEKESDKPAGTVIGSETETDLSNKFIFAIEAGSYAFNLNANLFEIFKMSGDRASFEFTDADGNAYDTITFYNNNPAFVNTKTVTAVNVDWFNEDSPTRYITLSKRQGVDIDFYNWFTANTKKFVLLEAGCYTFDGYNGSSNILQSLSFEYDNKVCKSLRFTSNDVSYIDSLGNSGKLFTVGSDNPSMYIYISNEQYVKPDVASAMEKVTSVIIPKGVYAFVSDMVLPSYDISVTFFKNSSGYCYCNSVLDSPIYNFIISSTGIKISGYDEIEIFKEVDSKATFVFDQFTFKTINIDIINFYNWFMANTVINGL